MYLKNGIYMSVLKSIQNLVLEALQGWAWSGGGRGIARVDVSVDGHHWAEAELSRPDGQSLTRTWAWQLGIGLFAWL